MRRARLKERLERVDCKAGVTHDAGHGECIDWIVPWDGQNTHAVGHDDVLALASDAKAGFLEGADGIQMVDARKLPHG